MVFLTVVTADVPHVASEERLRLSELGNGFYRLVLRYGFMELPDIPAALVQCRGLYGLQFDMMRTSFFVSRETIVPSLRPGMAMWRERLFAFMALQPRQRHELLQDPDRPGGRARHAVGDLAREITVPTAIPAAAWRCRGMSL